MDQIIELLEDATGSQADAWELFESLGERGERELADLLNDIANA